MHDRGEYYAPGRDSYNALSSGRVLENGDLRLATLALLSEKPRHGYEVIKEINRRFAGIYSPSPGSIYPLLTRLVAIRHAVVTEIDGRKTYSITDLGRIYVAVHERAIQWLFQRIETVRESHGLPEILELQ